MSVRLSPGDTSSDKVHYLLLQKVKVKLCQSVSRTALRLVCRPDCVLRHFGCDGESVVRTKSCDGGSGVVMPLNGLNLEESVLPRAQFDSTPYVHPQC